MLGRKGGNCCDDIVNIKISERRNLKPMLHPKLFGLSSPQKMVNQGSSRADTRICDMSSFDVGKSFKNPLFFESYVRVLFFQHINKSQDFRVQTNDVTIFFCYLVNDIDFVPCFLLPIEKTDNELKSSQTLIDSSSFCFFEGGFCSFSFDSNFACIEVHKSRRIAQNLRYFQHNNSELFHMNKKPKCCDSFIHSISYPILSVQTALQQKIQKKLAFQSLIKFPQIIIYQHSVMESITRLSKEQVDKLNNQFKKFRPQYYEDIPALTSDAPQVMSRQATLNVGTVGHVAHGKSTVVRAISGVTTVRFRQERVRNITIRLGYANAKIFKCPTCPAPDCFKSYPSDKEDDPHCDNKGCESTLVLQRHISFCDCPGHEVFLSTMLTGAAVMDAALLLIAANVQCPQPQTIEHLMALEIMKLQHMIVLQNKIDIIFKDSQKTRQNYKQIKEFMKGSICRNSPIIPISAQQKYNIDAVCESICDIPLPKRNLSAAPKMIIIRSFDVNKPGTSIDQLQGGVVGGSVLEGVLQVGMAVELRPGHLFKDADDNIQYTPIKSQIVSLMAENNQLLYAVPGGLIAVGLMIDPSITRNDRMVGNVLGVEGQLPDIFVEIDIQFSMLKKSMTTGADKKPLKITKIVQDETLKFNVGSTETPGKVVQVYDDIMKVKLNNPICTRVGEKVAFSRRIEKKFRLIGYATIKKGEVLAPKYD